jgi:hypothetical protein
MSSLKTPTQLATEAETLAVSFEFVNYFDKLYAPVDYETLDGQVIPPVDRKCWVPLSDWDILNRAQIQFDTLFKDKAQFANFEYMLTQSAQRVVDLPTKLLIKTSEGLKTLHEDGKLHDPDGSFVPNTIHWVLNEDPKDKEELFKIITDWVGDDEEVAISLLRHLATSLAPHWTAGKYVLLIGDGRNGKSVLMTMLHKLFGSENCSMITRQYIAEAEKSLFDLNGKLLNVVFDGPALFLQDSALEKSIITGELVGMRKLYSNSTSPIQTNALFIEGLNQEPRSKDKSSALQARFVRFIFPNTYTEDPQFFSNMQSERMLGALLSLLIDNYVTKAERNVMLAPTRASDIARLEHMESNSLALQYLVHVIETDPLGEQSLIGMDVEDFAAQFRSWRLKSNDISAWEVPAVMSVIRPVFITERKSKRVPGVTTPTKTRVITGFKKDAQNLLDYLKEGDNATTVVDD